MKQHRNPFTLMELLIVMILTGLLIGVTMPSFSKISTGQKLTQAAAEISGQISIARAYALANHCYTAVIIPTIEELRDNLPGERDKKDTSLLADYYNTTCRIGVITKKDKEFFFVMWMPGSSWVRLPQGTIFDEKEPVKNSIKETLQGVYCGALRRFYEGAKKERQPDSENVFDASQCIVIQPNGQLLTRSGVLSDEDEEDDDLDKTGDEIEITLTDGLFDKGRKDIRLLPRAKNTQVYLTLTVDTMTGRITQETKNR